MTDSGRKHCASFPKKERLTSQKDIEGLFKNSSSFYLYPLLMKFARRPPETNELHQLLFTVSRRNFKSAVKRNLIKRRMREAYRLNKSILDELGYFYNIGFVYVDKRVLSFKNIEDKLKSLLLRLKNQHSTKTRTDHPMGESK